jgi:hypothetical protein
VSWIDHNFVTKVDTVDYYNLARMYKSWAHLMGGPVENNCHQRAQAPSPNLLLPLSFDQAGKTCHDILSKSSDPSL